MENGEPCRAGPQRGRALCFAHDPERAEEMADARRLGGQRRRREGTVQVAYELPALDTAEGALRLVEIAVADVLALDNGVARCRLLLTAAVTATRVRESGDLDARVAALEAALSARTVGGPPLLEP
jgi:hypothetical protein